MKTAMLKFCGFLVAVAVAGLIASPSARAQTTLTVTMSAFNINTTGADGLPTEIELTSNSDGGPVQLDIGDVNSCVFTNTTSSYSGWNAIFNALQTGYASGWNPNSGGITMVNTNTAEYSLGYISTGADSAEIMTTYLGDTRLSGSVSSNGFLDWENGYTSYAASPIPLAQAWGLGDFNYSTYAYSNGFLQWENAFTSNLTPLGAAAPVGGAAFLGGAAVPALTGGLSSVPEPSSFVLFAVGAIALALVKRFRT